MQIKSIFGSRFALGAILLPIVLVAIPNPLSADVAPIELQLVATLADQVVHVTNSGVPGDDRLFLVRKRGIVQIYDGATVLATPFLDIDALVVGSGGLPTGDERGLLSIAFHPDYGTNGFFYVYYIDNNSDTVVARYHVSGNPNIADSLSAQTVLAQDQPAANHNGGQLQFGPDDYLYIGFGDGGGSCDNTGPGCNAQRTDSWLGSMLRIDIDGDDFPADPSRNYAVPADNPFVAIGAVVDEIWSYGLRNPWRFSFDRLTGNLWIGDVGQSGTSRREEINFQTAGVGGQNYGWPIAEGNQCDPGTCSIVNCPMPVPSCGSLTFPLYEYSGGCAVTGGYVYRGAAIAGLGGRYVFSDYCSGDITALDTSTLDDPVVADAGFELTTFGEDIDGELYIAVGNEIFKLITLCGNGALDAGEQCDAGANNGTGSSCCLATCQTKPNGAASCDGNLCTRPDTCTNGTCTPGACADGQACSICGGMCVDNGSSCDCN